MFNLKEVVVLSDLHMAAEANSGLFRADTELAACLQWILEQTKECTVILAGDVLDFLALNGDETIESFDLANAESRCWAIIEHHPKVFDALAALVQSPDHQLTIMGGNHDPELIFPGVQSSFEKRIASTAKRPTLQWFVNGEAFKFQVGSAIVLVEHGDIIDDWNRIDRAALRSALSLSSRGLIHAHNYIPPPGSQLVLDFVTPLKKEFSWIDWLKPEREAVFPLLLEFTSFIQKGRLLRALDEYFWKLERSIVSKVRDRLNKESRFRALGGDNSGNDSIASRRTQFKEWLLEQQRGDARTLFDSSASRLIERLRQVSAEDMFFETETADQSADDVKFLLEQGVDLIVNGHTHSAKAYRLGNGLYINTGTWASLLQLPMSYDNDEIWQKFLIKLRQNDVSPKSRPTFAHIAHNSSDGQTQAALLERTEHQPATLARYQFDSGSRTWRQIG